MCVVYADFDTLQWVVIEKAAKGTIGNMCDLFRYGECAVKGLYLDEPWTYIQSIVCPVVGVLEVLCLTEGVDSYLCDALRNG